MLNKADYYGFSIQENDAHEERNDILHCLVVGMLIFCAACGCVIGIAGQFELTINYPVVLIILFIAAMYLSLIQVSRLFYNVGYFAFLAIFSYALFSLRTYANSGYQALLNIISDAYSSHFLLSSVREYTEIITDRYVTLTTVSIFLGIFLVLLLNVDVFNNMIFATAFFLTFMPCSLACT